MRVEGSKKEGVKSVWSSVEERDKKVVGRVPSYLAPRRVCDHGDSRVPAEKVVMFVVLL